MNPEYKAGVYLICDPGTDLFKIGVTRDINNNKRLKQLQTGNGTELFISAVFPCEYPFRTETLLHRRYAMYREHGEWFRLPTDAVINFKKTCEQIVEIIHLMHDNPFFNKDLK